MAADRVWTSWGPEATLFHFGTKDVPWAPDFVAGERRLRRKAVSQPPPLPVKRLPASFHRTVLPSVAASGELDEVLAARRTWRAFGRGALSIADLSVLLERTWSVRHHGVAPGQGPVVLKSSPSGGACHPIEAYVLARRVSSLEPGLYHYESDRRRLALVDRGASRAHIARFLPGQPWFTGAAAIVFMSAVFARSAWRYPHGRAYRAILFEAGHLCQTFLLVATKLRLAPFCTQALADSVIERALGLDGIREGVLYAAGVGSRPAGKKSAAFPARYRKRLD